MDRKLVSCTALMLTAAAVLLTAPRARAAMTPEQQCQKARYEAAGKYANCELKAYGKHVVAFVGLLTKYREAASKCRVKYTDTWAKLQKKALGTGSTCDQPRFVDYGNAVVDNLTGLTWEKKVSPGGGALDPHDFDNEYAWNAGGAGGAADGPVFTNFLELLNTSPCTFTGYCDWRLPTRAELQTILLPECTTSPCIDPIFGPTAAGYYWATAVVGFPLDLNNAWVVSFSDGTLDYDNKSNLNYVRAVRAAL